MRNPPPGRVVVVVVTAVVTLALFYVGHRTGNVSLMLAAFAYLALGVVSSR